MFLEFCPVHFFVYMSNEGLHCVIPYTYLLLTVVDITNVLSLCELLIG